MVVFHSLPISPLVPPHQLPLSQELENKQKKFFLIPLENLSCSTNSRLKTKKFCRNRRRTQIDKLKR